MFSLTYGTFKLHTFTTDFPKNGSSYNREICNVFRFNIFIQDFNIKFIKRSLHFTDIKEFLKAEFQLIFFQKFTNFNWMLRCDMFFEKIWKLVFRDFNMSSLRLHIRKSLNISFKIHVFSKLSKFFPIYSWHDPVLFYFIVIPKSGRACVKWEV
jgi:hypothetical protein